MNKTKDSLVSFKLASMLTIFHASYFVALLALKEDPVVEECKTFDFIRNLLFWIHLSGGLY